MTSSPAIVDLSRSLKDYDIRVSVMTGSLKSGRRCVVQDPTRCVLVVRFSRASTPSCFLGPMQDSLQ